MINIFENLKELRKFTGLSQEKFGELIGINLRGYQKYEWDETNSRYAVIYNVLRQEINKKSKSLIESLKLDIKTFEIDGKLEIETGFKYYKLANISNLIPEYIIQSKPLKKGFSLKDLINENQKIEELKKLINNELHGNTRSKKQEHDA